MIRSTKLQCVLKGCGVNCLGTPAITRGASSLPIQAAKHLCWWQGGSQLQEVVEECLLPSTTSGSASLLILVARGTFVTPSNCVMITQLEGCAAEAKSRGDWFFHVWGEGSLHCTPLQLRNHREVAGVCGEGKRCFHHPHPTSGGA